MTEQNLTPDQQAMPKEIQDQAFDRIPMTCDAVRAILDEAAGKIINEFKIPNEEYAHVDAAISQAFLRIRDEVAHPFRTEQMKLLHQVRFPLTDEQRMSLASEQFLTKPLPPDFADWAETSQDVFLEDHVWEPLEDKDISELYELIENASDNMYYVFQAVAKELP